MGEWHLGGNVGEVLEMRLFLCSCARLLLRERHNSFCGFIKTKQRTIQNHVSNGERSIGSVKMKIHSENNESHHLQGGCWEKGGKCVQD